MKKVYYLCAVLSAILSASCSNRNVTDEGPHAVQQLTLTLNGAPMSRSAITTAPTTADEAKIHRVTIGIFGADGNVKSIQTKDQADTSTPLSGAVNFTVNNLVTAGDNILAVCNAPTANAFAGVNKYADFFKAATYDIVNTCNGDAVSGPVPATPDVQLSTSLPMFGPGTITIDGTGGFQAGVTVNHSVAKVSIGNIAVAFDANGAYANATFTPQEVFLLNTPQTAYYNCDANSSTFVTSPVLLTGENAPASGGTQTKAAYIGTGATDISSAPLAGTASFTANKFFYTNPNTNVNPTKLVIKGSFVAYSGASPQTCYYPVIINHAQTGTTKDGSATYTPDGADSYVLAGKAYQINVTIKSIGTDDPNKNITPASLAITLTVSDFTVVTQNVVFN